MHISLMIRDGGQWNFSKWISPGTTSKIYLFFPRRVVKCFFPSRRLPNSPPHRDAPIFFLIYLKPNKKRPNTPGKEIPETFFPREGLSEFFSWREASWRRASDFFSISSSPPLNDKKVLTNSKMWFTYTSCSKISPFGKQPFSADNFTRFLIVSYNKLVERIYILEMSLNCFILKSIMY